MRLTASLDLFDNAKDRIGSTADRDAGDYARPQSLRGTVRGDTAGRLKQRTVRPSFVLWTRTEERLVQSARVLACGLKTPIATSSSGDLFAASTIPSGLDSVVARLDGDAGIPGQVFPRQSVIRLEGGGPASSHGRAFGVLRPRSGQSRTQYATDCGVHPWALTGTMSCGQADITATQSSRARNVTLSPTFASGSATSISTWP